MRQTIILSALLAFALTGCDPDEVLVEDVPEFEKVFQSSGSQEAHRMVVIGDELFIVGTSQTAGESSVLLMRTDFNGNVRSTKMLATAINGEGTGIIHTSDGHLVIVGNQQTSNVKHILLMKVDLEGNTIWSREFGGIFNDVGKDVIQLTDGGFMLIGTTSSFSQGVADMYVIRTDGEGNELWSRAFGSNGYEGGSELLQINASEVMLLGFTEGFGTGQRDQWLLSVSTDGDSLWSTTVGGTGYEESQGIARTADGGLVLCGHSASIDPVHAMHGLKLNMDGTIMWEHHFGSPQLHDGGQGILVDADGNILFVGRSDRADLTEDMYIVKTDGAGIILSEEQIGEEGYQWATDAAESPTAHFILGTSMLNGDGDIMLVKRPK